MPKKRPLATAGQVPFNQRIALTLEDAEAATGIHRNTIRDACYKKALTSKIVCRKRMILRKDLEAWLDGRGQRG